MRILTRMILGALILFVLVIPMEYLHAQTPSVEISMDVSKSGTFINPNLYGQFIEHLGRCIQQGVWSEMLMDRKFLLPPGRYWKIMKPDSDTGEVMLDPAGAYTGDHCMALWLKNGAEPFGIRQDGIGLVKGRRYVGYAILADIKSAASVQLSISWGEGANEGITIPFHSVDAKYHKYSFQFTAGGDTDNASMSITVDRPAYLWIGCLSLMPADNVDGMRADTLKLIKELNPPIMRWPGGNFVSGYDWRDGIGPRDRRPPRWDRAWNNVEDNDFGIAEFMDFCRKVGCKPYIAVNTGLGTVRNAADEVEYFRGSAKSKWGAVRAENGHPAPYPVSWLGIGNEMFGDWQLGHIPVEQYALRNNAYVRAMREVDPKIKVIVVGAPGGWNDVIFPQCARYMNLLSGHFYADRNYHLESSPDDVKRYEANFVSYSGEVAAGIRGIVDDFKPRLHHASPQSADVRLAIDEWGIGGGDRYFCLGDAIAVARGMNELLRSVKYVSMANWAQTVNVLGAIDTTRNYACMSSIGVVLGLYRKHMEGDLIPMQLNGPVNESATVDAVASKDPKTGTACVSLVNYSPDASQAVSIHVKGFPNSVSAEGWRINSPKLDAINIPGQPEEVRSVPIRAPISLDNLLLPAHSITLIELK